MPHDIQMKPHSRRGVDVREGVKCDARAGRKLGVSFFCHTFPILRSEVKNCTGTPLGWLCGGADGGCLVGKV